MCHTSVPNGRSVGFTLAALTLVLFAVLQESRAGERVIFDFKNAEGIKPWEAVNDDVMGGVSVGRARVTDDGTLEFSGAVSLENNGGFASIRSRPAPVDLSGYDGLLIRVRGDGKRYAFTLRTNVRIMAGAYRAKFDTQANTWQEIFLPFSDFEATSFGQVRPDLPPLDPGKVRSFGFTIADKQAGPFKLELMWIKAVESTGRRNPQDRDAGAALQTSALKHWIEAAITRGAPLFNAGQVELCTEIYTLSVRSLVCLTPAELPAEAAEQLTAALTDAERESDSRKRAWILRRALDFTLEALSGSESAGSGATEASDTSP